MDALEQEIRALKEGLDVLLVEIEAAVHSWISAEVGEAKEIAKAHLI